MCNLYTERKSAAEVAAHFGVDLPVPAFNSAEDVYPGYSGMVVREEQGKRVLRSMTWGFPRHSKSKKTGLPNKPSPTNNARDDQLFNPYGMWSQWFAQPAHRCLIPFTAFAEAVGEKGAMTKTWISVTDQPLAAWAGLWRPTDEWGDAYTGVMVDATEELHDIHDRMPVILRPENHETWLHAPVDEAFGLVRKYPGDRLVAEHSNDPWSSRGRTSPPLPDMPILL
ncbi:MULTISPECIES: SOS response-associated peptidase family protein [unclassified Sphingopyxis]|uniref:SOS response-associated peptidase n=1 Tax=unclassified Sphingopyxis TaxID=2614943 RepID=UPI002854F5EF|nr:MULTISPECIES: SOS response-associated peptidase family protein [unclassified Sphingopyxis]MDR7060477.1 putative SOS response-associated peptidase YedK [Sphingopyxis sp. BE235]MDR7180010.1 putative SOS response-associated peptidase YedK [Sphingopyxis sp. BE249]